MEIFALIITVVATGLLIRNFYLNETIKSLRHDLSKADAMVRDLQSQDEEEDPDEELLEPDEDNQLSIGMDLGLWLGDSWVKGKLVSIAAESASKKQGLGFEFKVEGDKHSIWVDHESDDLFVLDDVREYPPFAHEIIDAAIAVGMADGEQARAEGLKLLGEALKKSDEALTPSDEKKETTGTP